MQSVLDILGLVQGVTLGVLLLVLNYKHFRSTYFLGMYLVLFSLKLATFIPSGLNLEQHYPELFLLPFDFSWLLFPLFFIYTQKISIFSDQKTKYVLLFPGIVSFLLQIIIYFLPHSTKLQIADSFWHELAFTISGILYSWGIAIWNLKLLNRHNEEVQNAFSYPENKVLKWVRVYLIYSLSTSVIIHILYYFSPGNYYFKIIFSVIDLIAIYWVAVNGIIQQNVLASLFKTGKMHGFRRNTDPEIYSSSDTGIKDLHALMIEIDSYMNKSEAFLESDLTIVDLADKLNVHPKKISSAINNILNQNFNSYVNQFRIKKAEEILTKQTSIHYSIEGIGREVGFHSKSAFYSAFKKFTGVTPSRYK